YFFFLHCCSTHRALHSFPTRRSSDLSALRPKGREAMPSGGFIRNVSTDRPIGSGRLKRLQKACRSRHRNDRSRSRNRRSRCRNRSEEHTSELQHLVISYAVFCLKKKK